MPGSHSYFGRTAVILTVILLLSLGLCGYTVRQNAQEVLGLALLSGFGIAVGGIGLLITGIAALASRGGRSSGPAPPPSPTLPPPPRQQPPPPPARQPPPKP